MKKNIISTAFVKASTLMMLNHEINEVMKKFETKMLEVQNLHRFEELKGSRSS